jgi:hypothetical protein
MIDLQALFNEASPQSLLSASVFVFLFAVYQKIKGYSPPASVQRPDGCHFFVGALPLLDKVWPTMPDFVLYYNERFGNGTTWCVPIITKPLHLSKD